HTLHPTTVSVGPYSFTNRASGNHSCFHLLTRSPPNCSPPITTTCRLVLVSTLRSTYSSASKCAGVILNSRFSFPPSSPSTPSPPSPNIRSAKRCNIVSSSGSNSTCLPTTSGTSSVVTVASNPNGVLTTEPLISSPMYLPTACPT